MPLKVNNVLRELVASTFKVKEWVKQETSRSG
jgi:hypothetical protein